MLLFWDLNSIKSTGASTSSKVGLSVITYVPWKSDFMLKYNFCDGVPTLISVTNAFLPAYWNILSDDNDCVGISLKYLYVLNAFNYSKVYESMIFIYFKVIKCH